MFRAAEVVVEITVHLIDVKDDVRFAGHANGDEVRSVAFVSQSVVGESSKIIAVAFFRFEEDVGLLNFGVKLKFEVSKAMCELLGSFGIGRAWQQRNASQQHQLAPIHSQCFQQFAHVFFLSSASPP